MPLDPDLNAFTTVGTTNTVFNWEDVIADIGYKTFFALRNNEGDALITSTIPSNKNETGVSGVDTLEMNFDHEFLAPSDIEGEGFVAFTLQVTGVAAVSDSAKGQIRLIHVDTGNNETEMVAQIDSDTIIKDSGVIAQRMCITMTIPNTHFAVGEKLRLEFILVVGGGGGAGTATLYHDPANRETIVNDEQTGDAPRSDLQLIIPFRIPV